jgi:transposase
LWGAGGVVKRAFKFRFYPSDGQAAELSRTFGCVRLVYNRALEERTRAWYGEQRRVSYVQSSALLTLSTGEKVTNPKHERRERVRLARARRRLSRKAKGSVNREKARRKVARVHARITDRRRDFLHHVPSR